MGEVLNWAIIGTGNIANEFAAQFDLETAKIHAVVSRNQTTADEFASKHAIERAYSDFAECLADEQVDVIYIATPHNTHYDYIMKSLHAGKHVVCEKAITINKKQLDKAYALAEKKELYLFEAMTIHYMPLYQEIKEWISHQDLGPLKMIQINFGSYKDLDPKYYFFNKELAGGALLDIGVYALSFARWFLSEQPHEIQSIGNIHTTGVDESSVIMLRNKKQELANISLTFRARMPKQGMVVYEEGYLTITDYPRPDQAVLTREDGTTAVFEKGNKSEALKYEAEFITDMIQNKKENPYINYTMDVMEIMDEVRRQWGLEYDFE